MTPETLDLARLQFALTAGAHFLFVSLTLGLATLVACVQTRATVSGSPVHERMTRFWGQLYLINYAMGIVTGLVMEFQFGLSWSGLTHYAGNVFGASLAMETLVAFFIESTFLGLWIFGWGRVNKWLHLSFLWIVTLTAYASAYWILVSNGFLQNPVGYEVDGDGLRLVDVGAVLTNSNSILAFFHILGGGLLVGGFFMAGVSAYHLRRRAPEHELFRRSLRIGVWITMPALFFTVVFGGIQMASLREQQPMKMAVFSGDQALIDDLQANAVASFGPGDYIPSAGLTRGMALLMIFMFLFMFFIGGISTLLSFVNPLVYRFRAWHVLLTLAIPIPFVGMVSGWLFRELGRQPWVVYELLLTRDAVSDVSPASMRASLIAFVALFGVLIAVNYWLLARTAKRGPAAVRLGAEPSAPESATTTSLSTLAV